MAWSEYKNGRWMGKNLSEAVTLTAYRGEANVLYGHHPERMPPREPSESLHPKENPPRSLVSKQLISFKALFLEETLVVRGFLRRDYHKLWVADSRIACPFGEFRFFGCRKIVTTAQNWQIARRNLPLAPTGTKFDCMWFTELTPGLTLFDGKFPESPTPPDTSALTEATEPASIADDPDLSTTLAKTLANKHEIPVLDKTPWRFRLLAPHQDLQFVGDRPFFFGDDRRTFVVSSTVPSGRWPRPDFGDWVKADLATAWRADYFPPTGPGGAVVPTGPSSEALQPLTVLTPGPGGQRIATRIPLVDLEPTFDLPTFLPTETTRQYTFANFHHPYLCEFVKTLNQHGIPALLSLDTQSKSDAQSFDVYRPEPPARRGEFPIDEVEFQSGRAYELYNWELFFHIPLLIADRLSKNQRFEEAQRWFHFIFDPTGASGDAIPGRYWRTKPFHDRLSGDYEAESVKTIEKMAANGPSKELTTAVEVWRSNPFSPHAVARLRTTAYQKTVVMKYIDNLIAWGDQLFRRETLEAINEATHLYVLAAEILGRRPEVIERNVKPPVQTFNSLAPGLLGNALKQLELLVSDSEGPGTTGDSSQTPDPPSALVLYFCVPENDKLLGYWSTVADRLFKIRHCMNIEGQVRQLPLFEPPIDPALLVRAQAAGLSLANVLNEISVSLPNYRFAVMLQKANEVVAEVRNLGVGLLSALEKRDAEAVSTLRSGQELRLLQALRDIRVNQIDEAKANSVALQESRNIADARKQYYESREFMNAEEKQHLHLLSASNQKQKEAQAVEILGNIYSMYPNATFGSSGVSSPVVTVQFGGTNMALAAQAFARSINSQASDLSFQATRSATIGGHRRRGEEWKYQGDLAARELKQIDKQILAAQIRQAIAEEELKNHDQQVENAKAVDAFMHDKFTNQDLYQWMTGQVSGLYFQSYQLAYDLAKRAELCMQHELGLAYRETSFIRFGYWDSLKKGLLAGDQLAHDLKRLDIAYLDGNVREYELTKHVSLISLAPEQLIDLKETGSCDFEIPEWLFDLDTPGHYMRRLKMVSVTIPCVTGPYASIHCKLRLLNSSYRRNTGLDSGYDRLATDDTSGSDERFIDDRTVVEAIVTSTAQNDAGLFESSMRDERYLPFEGAGARSQWRLELPMAFKSFDYGTISDVILHLRYTARDLKDDGNEFRDAATASVTNLLEAADAKPLFRLFSLRHEFPSEWHRFVGAPASAINAMTVDLAATRFPYFVQSREITVRQATVIARTKSDTPVQAAVAPGQAVPDLTQNPWTGEGSPGPWTFATSSDPKLVEDVFVIFAYSAG